jgi:hypothetical protein
MTLDDGTPTPATPTPVDGSGAAPAGNQVETSLIPRFVALATPLFAIVAGWIAGWAAHALPGLQLDQTQIVTFMTAAAVAALSAAWKWLHGWQQHERLVAEGRDKPVRPAPGP